MKSAMRIVGIVCLALALMGFESGDSPSQGHRRMVVPAGQVHNGWYFGAGDEVLIEGTVNGDVFAAGGRVEVSGTINGDLIAAGGQIVISGTVSQDVRAAGGVIQIDGRVLHSATTAGGSVALGKTGTVGDDFLAAGGDIRIGGHVEREVMAGTGSFLISGTIGSHVRVSADRISVLEGAQLLGDLHARVADRRNVDITPGTVRGTVEIIADTAGHRTTILGYSPFRFWFKLLFALSLVVTAFALIFLLPARVGEAAAMMTDDAGLTLLWGIAGFFLIPIVAIVLCVTLIGLPLGFFALFLYLWFLYLSQLSLPVLAGRWIKTGEAPRRWAMFWPVAIALLVMQALTMVPYLGVVIEIAAAFVGLGVLMRLVGRRIREGRTV